MSEHYFSARPGSASKPREITFRLDGRAYALKTDSHVFSADRLDPGTAVLLREAPRPQGTSLLDLGCGYGPIACVLAVRRPEAQVWAVDVNDRARALAVVNAQALAVADRVHVVEADGVPDATTFDEIWSNPPIRIGKPALHRMLLHWLPRLRPHGIAWLVVAKNLGSDSLQRWLADQGHGVDRYTSVRGYRVLRVRPRVLTG